MCINTWEATLYFHGKTKGLGMPSQQMLRICYISPGVRTPFVGNESVQGTLLQLYEAVSMVEGHRGVQGRGRWMWPRQNFPGTRRQLRPLPDYLKPWKRGRRQNVILWDPFLSAPLASTSRMTWVASKHTKNYTPPACTTAWNSTIIGSQSQLQTPQGALSAFIHQHWSVTLFNQLLSPNS